MVLAYLETVLFPRTYTTSATFITWWDKRSLLAGWLGMKNHSGPCFVITLSQNWGLRPFLPKDGAKSIARFSWLNAGLHTPLLWATAHPHGSVQSYKHLQFVKKAKFLATLHGGPWLSAKSGLCSLAFNKTGQQEAFRMSWKKRMAEPQWLWTCHKQLALWPGAMSIPPPQRISRSHRHGLPA